MLTKELLRFTKRQGKIYPRFIDTGNRLLLTLAEELEEIYRTGIDLTAEELTEVTQPILAAASSPILAKGLNKLLLDRCRFREPDNAPEKFRMEVFQQSALLLRQPGLGELSRYRHQVGAFFSLEPEELTAQLYGDLPSRLPLAEFRPYGPERLLHRYNIAQVQGLLLRMQSLTIFLRDAEAGKRRMLFRFLKFFRLLATIRQIPGEGDRIQIDGPLSILENTQKYGLQLALFFPMLCTLERWQLQGEVRFPGEAPYLLTLDEKSGLVADGHGYTVYRPDELLLFTQQFQQAGSDWSVQEEVPILDLGQQVVVAPDVSFRHLSGQVVHVELFHRWHAGQLMARLQRLEQEGSPLPLAIGVDRSLGKNPAIRTRLERSAWFQLHGFEYHEFPPIKRVLKTLDSFI